MGVLHLFMCHPQIRGTKMKGTKNKTGRKDLKVNRDPLSRGSLWEMLQQGAGSSGEPLSGPVATSEPAVEISAKGRNEPMVQNLPERHWVNTFWNQVTTLTSPCPKSYASFEARGLLREWLRKGKHNRPLGRGARAEKAYPSNIHSFIHSFLWVWNLDPHSKQKNKTQILGSPSKAEATSWWTKLHAEEPRGVSYLKSFR
jgi:hypothetical protein